MEIEDKQSMPHYNLTTCTQACFYILVSLLWETNFGLCLLCYRYYELMCPHS